MKTGTLRQRAKELQDRPGPWTRDQWLEWASAEAAVNLATGQAFGVSAPQEKARVMYQASSRYVLSYELGRRVMAEIKREEL